MTEDTKGPDKRITELKNFHNGWYKHQTKSTDFPEGIAAPWGPKQAKLAQTLLRYADSNSLSCDDVIEVMTLYMQSQDEFIRDKAKYSFEYFCQDFTKHFVEWRKAQPKSQTTPKLKPGSDDPAWDLNSWEAKRKYFDGRFNEMDDEEIRAYLQKSGVQVFKAFAAFPMLLNFPSASFNNRLFMIAKELFGRDEMVKWYKGGQLQEHFNINV